MQKEKSSLIFLFNNHLLQSQKGTCRKTAGDLLNNGRGSAEKQRGTCWKTAGDLLKTMDFWHRNVCHRFTGKFENFFWKFRETLFHACRLVIWIVRSVVQWTVVLINKLTHALKFNLLYSNFCLLSSYKNCSILNNIHQFK